MDISGWKTAAENEALRNQISDYVKEFVNKELPRISFCGYREFIHSGSRKESEASYFLVRKQLTALGLYLQWTKPSREETDYFNELLWSVSNEFSWCLAAHLPYCGNYLKEDAQKQIDLFAAETAETLSELLVLHTDMIDPFIQAHIRKQVKKRVLDPFLDRHWSWETSRNNWCAVCAGSIGITALLLENEKRKQILDKVDRALEFYIESFGTDGASEEGIGYWAYGFGYFIYYTAMRLEWDEKFKLQDNMIDTIKKIAEFPAALQIGEDRFIPFSDAVPDTIIPTGLLSYLYYVFGVTPPFCTKITPFDFEACYRFAHISRNLWWTDGSIYRFPLTDMVRFFEEKQWLLQRKDGCFFAIKGGNNQEEHNHNDVGSFVLALEGELYLVDLGAGPYTKDYFGAQRYQYLHTRSYWHNLPIVQQKEQIQTKHSCDFNILEYTKEKIGVSMELSMLYQVPALQTFRRTIVTDLKKHKVLIEDHFRAAEGIMIEEGLVSKIKPELSKEGLIEWRGCKGLLSVAFDPKVLGFKVESEKISNHTHQMEQVYRLGLYTKASSKDMVIRLEFFY